MGTASATWNARIDTSKAQYGRFSVLICLNAEAEEASFDEFDAPPDDCPSSSWQFVPGPLASAFLILEPIASRDTSRPHGLHRGNVVILPEGQPRSVTLRGHELSMDGAPILIQIGLAEANEDFPCTMPGDHGPIPIPSDQSYFPQMADEEGDKRTTSTATIAFPAVSQEDVQSTGRKYDLCATGQGIEGDHYKKIGVAYVVSRPQLSQRWLVGPSKRDCDNGQPGDPQSIDVSGQGLKWEQDRIMIIPETNECGASPQSSKVSVWSASCSAAAESDLISFQPQQQNLTKSRHAETSSPNGRGRNPRDFITTSPSSTFPAVRQGERVRRSVATPLSASNQTNSLLQSHFCSKKCPDCKGEYCFCEGAIDAVRTWSDEGPDSDSDFFSSEEAICLDAPNAGRLCQTLGLDLCAGIVMHVSKPRAFLYGPSADFSPSDFFADANYNFFRHGSGSALSSPSDPPVEGAEEKTCEGATRLSFHNLDFSCQGNYKVRSMSKILNCFDQCIS